MEYREQMVEKAIKMGAVHAVPFQLQDIVFDPRTLLKCMFGCGDWGKGHTCPSRPGSPTPDAYEQMFRRYQWGLIIHGHDKHTTQRISYELERQAFFDGYYFAFSMSDCGLCQTCAGHDGLPCRFPKKARPAFHSVGIDVFATVRGMGLPIRTLREEGETQDWYAALFVE